MIPARLSGIRFRAMNCEMAAWVDTPERAAATARLRDVRAFMEEVEARLSRFDGDSELSRLNASGGPVRVSELLWTVLAEAVTAAEESGGLFDPTVLDSLEAIGYDQTFERIARDRQAPAQTSLRPPDPRRRGWRRIRLDPIGRTVTLEDGVRVDLGGIAKGWAADRAAAMLDDLGPCLVDAGGDLAAHGRPAGMDGWLIGVADPAHPDSDLTTLLIADRGIATSGTDVRRWRRGEEIVHHLIDPRTGRPAETDLLSVTVVASTTREADLHAKVALLLGPSAGRAYLERRRGVAGLLVRAGGEVVTTAQ